MTSDQIYIDSRRWSLYHVQGRSRSDSLAQGLRRSEGRPMGQDVSVAEAKAGNEHLMPVVPSTSFHADGLKSWALSSD